jgi:hypothetical protein
MVKYQTELALRLYKAHKGRYQTVHLVQCLSRCRVLVHSRMEFQELPVVLQPQDQHPNNNSLVSNQCFLGNDQAALSNEVLTMDLHFSLLQWRPKFPAAFPVNSNPLRWVNLVRLLTWRICHGVAICYLPMDNSKLPTRHFSNSNGHPVGRHLRAIC